MNGQMTKSAYSPRGTARNPTMNRYLPCCIASDPDLRAGAARAGPARRRRTGPGDGFSLVLVVLDRRVLGGLVGEGLDLLDGLGRGDAAGHHLAEARHTDLLLLQLHVPVLDARVQDVLAGQFQRRDTGLQTRGQLD